MRPSRVIVAAGALLAIAAPAGTQAQIESTPIPATLKPNFAALQFMLGTWTCSTKSSRRPAPFVTVSTYSPDPTGYWIVEKSTIAKLAWTTAALTTWDHITYDPSTKRWVDVSYGDQGAYGLSFSKGWSGDRLVWHDVSFAPSPDIATQSDTTFTKVSPTRTTSLASFTEAKTGRRVSVRTTCMKP